MLYKIFLFLFVWFVSFFLKLNGFLVCIYLLPSVFAGIRGNEILNPWKIFLLNLFLGWSGVGWWVSLMWAGRGFVEDDQSEKSEDDQSNREGIGYQIFYVLLNLLFFFGMIVQITEDPDMITEDPDLSLGVLLVVLPFINCTYFLPSAIVFRRVPINRWNIFLLNLFLGWTGWGWWVSLMWATGGKTEAEERNAWKKKKKEVMEEVKKKQESDAIDSLSVTLSDLKPGYILDYDLKTWQVTAQHYCDYEGDRVDGWELTCGDDVAYLERSEDDSITWVLTRKIPLSDVEGDIRGYMRDHDNADPPDEVRCHGIIFYGISAAVGSFYKDGGDEGQEFIIWNYLDESEEHTLSIEQWDEDAFEAAVGEIVEEYQFSNILPVDNNAKS